MAFGRGVITFMGLNLPYARVAPHLYSILRRLGSSEHFGGRFGSGGAKTPPSFSFFMLGINSVSFTLVSLFFGSGFSSVNVQPTNPQPTTSWFESFPFLHEFRPPGSKKIYFSLHN